MNDTDWGILTILLLFIGYILPAIIALWNGKRNWLAISALTILTGWTVIGWIIAFIWALVKDRPIK